jgi:hypothetical protein
MDDLLLLCPSRAGLQEITSIGTHIAKSEGLSWCEQKYLQKLPVCVFGHFLINYAENVLSWHEDKHSEQGQYTQQYSWYAFLIFTELLVGFPKHVFRLTKNH